MHTCTVVEQNKAIITYVQLLKEDLAIFRLVPDNGVVPEYDAGQFTKITFASWMQVSGKII